MKPHSRLATENVSRGLAFLLLAAFATATVQACLAQAGSAPVHQATHRAKPHAARQPDPAPAPAAPEAPPKPDWPVNDPPTQPAVKWDAQGLQIQAANASLRQILDQVVSTTGSKIEGLNKDERVFGNYGPAPAKDVLSQLLHGTGYNVLMLGDVGQGAPREIVLSARNTNAPANNRASQPNNGPAEEEEQESEEQPQPQPIQPPMMQGQPGGGPPPPGPLLSPQQRMQQMQHQQEEMQRQQQQQLQQMQQNQQQ